MRGVIGRGGGGWNESAGSEERDGIVCEARGVGGAYGYRLGHSSRGSRLVKGAGSIEWRKGSRGWDVNGRTGDDRNNTERLRCDAWGNISKQPGLRWSWRGVGRA